MKSDRVWLVLHLRWAFLGAANLGGFGSVMDFEKLRKRAEQYTADGIQIGCQVYVSVDGVPVVDLALGDARPGVAMRPDTLMPWLSAGKPITAAAIAQVWENGALDLDRPVASWIPAFAKAGKAKITVRHLLTHTGGFRTADTLVGTQGWDETIQRICDTPLEPEWIPGETAGYHLGSSWLVLGEIVGRITGQSYGEYVRHHIFEPSGMTDSWLGMPPERYRAYGDRIGQMQVCGPAVCRPHPFLATEAAAMACLPGGGAWGPIRELGRFYESLLGLSPGKREKPLLKTSTIDLFTRRQRVGKFDLTFKHRLDWGLGFIVNSNRYGIETAPYGFGRYASEDSFGHGGAQSSMGFADPQRRLAVAWVCNGMPGERRHQQRNRELNSAIYEDLENA